MHKTVLVLVLAGAVSRQVPAQTVDALRRGVRIEVVPIQGKPQTGTFLSLRNDSLLYATDQKETVMSAGTTLLAMNDVRSIRVSLGKSSGDNTTKFVGTAAGTALGAIVGLALGMSKNSPMTGWAVGSVLGTGLGFAAGSNYAARHSDEKWESVDMRRH